MWVGPLPSREGGGEVVAGRSKGEQKQTRFLSCTCLYVVSFVRLGHGCVFGQQRVRRLRPVLCNESSYMKLEFRASLSNFYVQLAKNSIAVYWTNSPAYAAKVNPAIGQLIYLERSTAMHTVYIYIYIHIVSIMILYKESIFFCK